MTLHRSFGWFEAMRPWLPTKCAALLDIGSGRAEIDALLARHWTPRPEIHLLDGDGSGKQISGFVQSCGPWKDVNAGAVLLREQGIACEVHSAFPNGEFDLIISSLSWCHHYPADVYLDRVRAALRGRLIADVRRGTDGAAKLAAHFRFLAVIAETRKTQRMVFEC